MHTLVGVMTGPAFVDIRETSGFLKASCTDVQKAWARRLRMQLAPRKLTFGMAFSPMASFFSETARVIAEIKDTDEPEFVPDLYIGETNDGADKIAAAVRQLGNAPLSKYLSTPAKEEILLQGKKALDEVMFVIGEFKSIANTSLVVGPSVLTAAMGVAALKGNADTQGDEIIAKFIQELQECHQKIAPCFIIRYDAHGAPYDLDFVRLSHR